LIKRKLNRIEAIIPFSTIRKRSITAVRHPDQEDLIRIYIKGAPEFIIGKCSRTFDADGSTAPLQDEESEKIMQEILHD
jgi:magnesium-transporting ATPase (P-type)